LEEEGRRDKCKVGGRVSSS